VVGEQPGRIGRAAGRLPVADGLNGVGVFGEPSRGEPVQLRDVPGEGAA
jgi:hypothetical protein